MSAWARSRGTAQATVDVEVAELLRDEPELLAIADAITATQDERALGQAWSAPPGRRRVALRVVVAAALALVAALLALTAPWQGRGESIVGRALAAVGSGPVLHAVIEGDLPGESLVTLSTGARRPVHQQLAYWYLPGKKLRAMGTVEGQLQFDTLLTSRRDPSVLAHLDPALTAFIRGYRAALRGGEAREIGRGQVEGRRVIWLRFSGAGLFGERVAIDAQSYRPLLIERLNANGQPGSEALRITAIDTRPYRAADFRASSAPIVGISEGGSYKAIRLQAAAARVGFQPLWLGHSFHGRQLQLVQLQTTTRTKPLPRKTSLGLVFSYGRGQTARVPRGSVGPEFLRITESKQPGPAQAGVGPRPSIGTAIVSEIPRSFRVRPGGELIRRQCSASLRQGGLWITIWGWNRASSLCVPAARALTSMPTR